MHFPVARSMCHPTSMDIPLGEKYPTAEQPKVGGTRPDEWRTLFLFFPGTTGAVWRGGNAYLIIA